MYVALEEDGRYIIYLIDHKCKFNMGLGFRLVREMIHKSFLMLQICKE